MNTSATSTAWLDDEPLLGAPFSDWLPVAPTPRDLAELLGWSVAR